MYNFVGRKKIQIPISKEDFYKNITGNLLEFIGGAVSQHQVNVEEIQALHKEFLGQQTIIKSKKRYDSSEINNIVVENHLFRQVNFKVGFMYGNPLEYTVINEKVVNNDDMLYLNKYIADISKPSLDIEKAQDLFEFGIAYQRIFPKRTEIEDIENESPFELVNMPIEKTFLVYSNDMPSEKLFGVVLSEKYNYEYKKTENCYQVYLPNRKIEIEPKTNKIIKDIPQPYPYIPIKEFCLNKDRMGIVELVVSLQNLINKIDSSEMDSIEETINAFIVLFNQKTDDDFMRKFKELKKEKVLVLNTNNPSAPADMKILSSKIDQENSQSFYERVVKAMYDIASVPLSSGNVTSGGDTGQARLLGNGWESAQNQAQVDQTYLVQFERDLLKNMLWICKNTANCPVDKVSASDIAIKFNINMSNNLYVKSEALKMLNDIYLPEKAALNIVGITKDVDGLGEAWKQNKEKIRLQEIEKEKELANISSASTQTNEQVNE